MLVGDEEVEVPAPAQAAVDVEAADRGEVVGLQAQAVLVEALDRRVAARPAASKRSSDGPAAWPDARRLVLEPRLVRGHLRVWAGRALPSNTWNDCQPCQENSWLSHIGTNGQRARASCRSGSWR